jgi:anti-repressor protein
MSNLIKIQTNDNLEQVISARELHEKLNIEKHFSQWWAYQTERLGLIEGKDFLTTLLESQGGRPGTDYLIPLDIAKHLCMISGGENAHAIRQYFIQVEKAWNSPEMVMSRALKLAERKIMSLEEERQALLPKADQFDKFISGENYQDMNTAAKALGWGRNKLFAELRERKILMADNRPYQTYIDRGYFVVKEKPIDMGGTVFNKPQTYVTAKGLSWLEKVLNESGVMA